MKEFIIKLRCEEDDILASFGFYHELPNKKYSINNDSLLITENNFTSIDIDEYFIQAEKILTTLKYENKEKKEDNIETNMYEQEDGKDDLLSDLLKYVDKTN